MWKIGRSLTGPTVHSISLVMDVTRLYTYVFSFFSVLWAQLKATVLSVKKMTSN